MWALGVILDEGTYQTNIAVDPALPPQGDWAAEIWNQCLRKPKAFGATSMTLEVRVSNTGAQTLYKKLGLVDGDCARDTTPTPTKTRHHYVEGRPGPSETQRGTGQMDGLTFWISSLERRVRPRA
jgi:hypothetical protein